jgi:hypothetical protein
MPTTPSQADLAHLAETQSLEGIDHQVTFVPYLLQAFVGHAGTPGCPAG